MNTYKVITIDYSDILSSSKEINFTRGTDFPIRKSVLTPNIDRTRGLSLSLRKYLIYLYINILNLVNSMIIL
jgi:hypothetical protein